MVYCTTPDGSGGGIWQSGDGITIDASGRIYVVTGNGLFDADSGGKNYGDSVISDFRSSIANFKSITRATAILLRDRKTTVAVWQRFSSQV